MSTYQIIGLVFAVVGIMTLLAMFLDKRRTNSLDLAQMPQTEIMVWVSRLMIGGLFLYSGYVKANDYIGFAYKLEEYFYVFSGDLPALKGFFMFWVPLAEPMAWFISVFEIALGVAIILGYRMPLTTWLTLIMMVFFTFLTGYSSVTGSVTDCGCFGDALKLEPWESFVKDIILTGMLIPVFLVRKSIIPIPSQRIAGLIVLVVFLLSGAYGYYCHENLPLVDYRPYKVGKDLRECTTVFGPDGYPKCKDWPFLDEENTIIDIYTLRAANDSLRLAGKPYKIEARDPFVGKVLMMITNKVEDAPASAIQASGVLARELADSGIYIMGATSTGPSTMETLIPKYDLPYDFAFMDETVIKTIIRSHPGYLLMKDGVVIKKWHHNNQPTAADIKALAQ
ncbi:MAG: DoxX family protein [Bacteroidota bacterium]